MDMRLWAGILAFSHMSPQPLSTSSKAACLFSNMFGINSFAIVLVSLSLPSEGNWQVLSQLPTDLKQRPGWNSHTETNLRAKTSPVISEVCALLIKAGFMIRVGKSLNVLKLSYHIKKKCHSDIYKVMESHSHLLRLPFNTSPLSSAKRTKILGLQCEL